MKLLPKSCYFKFVEQMKILKNFVYILIEMKGMISSSCHYMFDWWHGKCRKLSMAEYP